MRKRYSLFATLVLAGGITVSANTPDADSLSMKTPIVIGEVVVTGTRNQTDIRHLSQTVSVVNRNKLEQAMQPSLLPVLTEQVPGLFCFAWRDGLRSIERCGRRHFAARTGGGNARLMVLIDGHPQYAGIFGHPISDAYQTLLADRVGSVAWSGIRAVWFKRDGWCGEHRYP